MSSALDIFNFSGPISYPRNLLDSSNATVKEIQESIQHSMV